MAKIDEIAELLTEEIHNFEKSVDKLEDLQSALKDFELKPDTSLVNQMLNEYHELQQKRYKDLRELVLEVVGKIDKSQLIPHWQVWVLWIWSFLFLLGWGITLIYLLKN